MALVEYSDSEGEAHVPAKQSIQQSTPSISSPNPIGLKRKRPASNTSSELPPLPASFNDLYSTAARASTRDDPSLHGGRTRSVPHVEGNWPTHVYLEWYPSSTEAETLESLVNVARRRSDASQAHSSDSRSHIRSSLQSELGVLLPLHISLSRTLQLQATQRDPFVEALNAEVKRANLRPFEATFTGLKWVSNHEGNRFFLVLGAARPEHDELNKLLKSSNRVAAAFTLPQLYANAQSQMRNAMKGKKGRRKLVTNDELPVAEDGGDFSDAFHISIAWTLDPALKSVGSSLDLSTNDAELRKLRSLSVHFSAVKIKIGNAVHTLDFNNRSA